LTEAGRRGSLSPDDCAPFPFPQYLNVADRMTVNGPCLLDYLILKLRLPVVLYVSFAVDY